jgi:hypothetical protein
VPVLLAVTDNLFQACDMKVQAKKIFPFMKSERRQAESNVFCLLFSHMQFSALLGNERRAFAFISIPVASRRQGDFLRLTT